MSQWVDVFALKEAQAEAVTSRDRDLIVSAGAGSGKTRTLTARYLSLLDEGYPPRGLAAITFTEKAAREMRNRIRRAIFEWRTGNCPPEDRPRWESLEAEIDTARIGTIHGMCAAILRAQPAEAEIDPRFDVLDEGLAATLRAQAVADALNWAGEHAELQTLFTAFETVSLASLLSELMAAPLDAQAALAIPDLAARWAKYLDESLRAFVDSGEICSAIADLRALGTGQPLASNAGDKLADQVQELLAGWTLLETQLVKADASAAAQTLFNIRRHSCAGNIGKKGTAKESVKVIRESYDEHVNIWLGGKNKQDPPPDPEANARAAALQPLIARVFDHALGLYQSGKDQRQALDFDDLESKMAVLMQRPEIRARWQKQIAALMVDEFQDTNARQRQIVEALAGTVDDRTGRLFVVGDAKQSIYRFRGADVSVFREMGQAIESRGGLPLTLDRTYRAHAGLVAAVNELMAVIMGESESPREPYRVPFAPLLADRSESEARLPAPHIEFLCGVGDTAADARPVAAQLLAWRLLQLRADGTAWDQMVLLFRASTGFPSYEAALESAGIPFVTVAGRGFYDRPEIRDVLNLLRALADPWDDLALTGALRSPAFGLSDVGLYRLRWPTASDPNEPMSLRAAIYGDLLALPEPDRAIAARARDTLARLQGWADRVPVAELLKALLDETHYLAILAGHPHGARMRRNLDKLLADAHASGLVRLTDFLEYLETLRDVGAREGEAPADAGGAVRLMTVHKAKGLEFPVVVLADAAHATRSHTEEIVLSADLGLVPAPSHWPAKPVIFRLARQAEATKENAEDARLLYVAATRAREKLIISGHLTVHPRDTWLTQLAEAAGLDLNALIQQRGHPQIVTLKCGQRVGGLAGEAVEIVPWIPVVDPTLPETEMAPEAQAAPLFTPVAEIAPLDPDHDSPRRPHRITGRLRHSDGTVAGDLVHEAIRRWRFPGDPGFDRLLNVAVKSLGLVDSEQAAEHLARATELLARFRADIRWVELDVAERTGRVRHEVPYSLTVNGRPTNGFIDLLYRNSLKEWQVADFKTDTLPNEAALNTLHNQYAPQLRRYRATAKQLLGEDVMAELCFLGYENAVRWVKVE